MERNLRNSCCWTSWREDLCWACLLACVCLLVWGKDSGLRLRECWEPRTDIWNTQNPRREREIFGFCFEFDFYTVRLSFSSWALDCWEFERFEFKFEFGFRFRTRRFGVLDGEVWSLEFIQSTCILLQTLLNCKQSNSSYYVLISLSPSSFIHDCWLCFFGIWYR